MRVPAEAATLLSAARSLSLVAGEAIPLLTLRRRGEQNPDAALADRIEQYAGELEAQVEEKNSRLKGSL